MSDYIENKKVPIATYGVTTSTSNGCADDCECDGDCGCNTSSSSNLSWYDDLYAAWNKMSDDEKASLFYEMIHFIDPRDIEKKKLDPEINKDIVSFGMSHWRSIQEIKFQLDRNNIPMYTIIYSPINIDKLYGTALYTEMKLFRDKYIMW